MMEDLFGHRISYLRISVTDRCNERCRYCLPEETQAWIPREQSLSYEEMHRVLAVGTQLGISKIRITGGEPLTRPGICDFVDEVCALPAIRQVGISSNGTLLTRSVSGSTTIVERLKKAGITSLNLSLDSLNREIYKRATSRDYLPQVLEGIAASKAVGIPSIRINCVLTKNQTENELIDLVDFAFENGLLLRFIELMPVSTKEVLKESSFLACGTAKAILELRLGALEATPNFKTNGPATYYKHPHRDQKIGFIGAMTNLHFCESCNKLRLTSDGKLRPCLGSYLEFDLLQHLRRGCSDEELRALILGVVARKPKEHDFRDNYQPNRRMIAIGG